MSFLTGIRMPVGRGKKEVLETLDELIREIEDDLAHSKARNSSDPEKLKNYLNEVREIRQGVETLKGKNLSPSMIAWLAYLIRAWFGDD